MKLRKGDEVEVLAGKDIGKRGAIMRAREIAAAETLAKEHAHG